MNTREVEALLWNRAAVEVRSMDLSLIAPRISAEDRERLEAARQIVVRHLFRKADQAAARAAAYRQDGDRPTAWSCYVRAKEAGHALRMLPDTHQEQGIYIRACAHRWCRALLSVEGAEANASRGIDAPCPYEGGDMVVY